MQSLPLHAVSVRRLDLCRRKLKAIRPLPLSFVQTLAVPSTNCGQRPFTSPAWCSWQVNDVFFKLRPVGFGPLSTVRCIAGQAAGRSPHPKNKLPELRYVPSTDFYTSVVQSPGA